jgi:RNA polymerase sigma factor (TIGR02999 family)
MGGLAEITKMLGAVEGGDPKAAEELLAVLYDELRALAAAKLAKERPGQTLQATALVHEAWLRLAGPQQTRWRGRNHFFAAAAEAMRRILVDIARRKSALRHGGGQERLDIQEIQLANPMPDEELLALDEALTKLKEFDARAARLVELRFFAGLTQEQAAEQMEISVATTERVWAFARAWLFRELKKDVEMGS